MVVVGQICPLVERRFSGDLDRNDVFLRQQVPDGPVDCRDTQTGMLLLRALENIVRGEGLLRAFEHSHDCGALLCIPFHRPY
jgi:hypothetical protein